MIYQKNEMNKHFLAIFLYIIHIIIFVFFNTHSTQTKTNKKKRKEQKILRLVIFNNVEYFQMTWHG